MGKEKSETRFTSTQKYQEKITLKPDTNLGENTQTNFKTDNYIPSPNLPGRITSEIGSGDNAKNSILYRVLGGCFCLFLCISLFLFLEKIMDMNFNKNYSFIDSIERFYDKLSPLITLTLGYAFGNHYNKT